MNFEIHTGCKKLHDGTHFNNLRDLLDESKKVFGNKNAFRYKTKEPGKFETKTYNDFVEDINAFGTALISIGLKDKRIALISENRYEWSVSYFSTVNGTGVIVPLDRSLPELEIINLVEASNADAIIYSKKYDSTMEKIRNEKLGNIKFFISMDTEESTNEVYSLKELIKIGKDLIKNGARTFIDCEIDREKLCTMLFTSGTTSKSKAVKLSHKNLCSNVNSISTIFDLSQKDVVLSFLPLHHTYECTVGFLYPLAMGCEICYCEGLRHIADNIREYKISAMISVPVLFENLYKNVMKEVNKKGMTKKVETGMKISKFLRKIGINKGKQIFKEIHDSLGGNLRIFVAGAAAFDPDIEEGLNNLGIETYQGYGLTETSPVIAAEHKKNLRFGSVGKVIPGLEVGIFEPNEEGIGEVVVKGDSIMDGYIDNPDATKEVLIDGWFHTGDLGYFDKDEYLYITGRKKDVIVLKNGKNIYPEEIEGLINDIEGVKESFVFGKPENGDEKNLKISAKVVYDKNTMKNKFGLEDEKEIKDYIWKEIKEINKKMPTYKYVKELIVTDKELIKTTTLKIKRFEEIKTIDMSK